MMRCTRGGRPGRTRWKRAQNCVLILLYDRWWRPISWSGIQWPFVEKPNCRSTELRTAGTEPKRTGNRWRRCCSVLLLRFWHAKIQFGTGLIGCTAAIRRVLVSGSSLHQLPSCVFVYTRRAVLERGSTRQSSNLKFPPARTKRKRTKDQRRPLPSWALGWSDKPWFQNLMTYRINAPSDMAYGLSDWNLNWEVREKCCVHSANMWWAVAGQFLESHWRC